MELVDGGDLDGYIARRAKDFRVRRQGTEGLDEEFIWSIFI